MKKITVIDYGLGNLFSVARAFEHVGAEVLITDDRAKIKQADYLLLPGVGAFEKGMQQLKSRGLDEAVHDYARLGRPLMGICLGMQMLFEIGEENGENAGLGLIPGRVQKIAQLGIEGEKLRVPHIGWSKIVKSGDARLLAGLPDENSFYFVHSYQANCADEADLSAFCYYGGNQITATVEHENIFGCQFHPEKSAASGLALCNSFLQI